jgi:hypothetical protein
MSIMTMSKKQNAKAQGLKASKKTKKVRKVSKRKYAKRIDVASMQALILGFFDGYGDSPVSITTLGKALGIKGSPSNVYQRLLRVLKPMRGKVLDWSKGKGKGIYLLPGAAKLRQKLQLHVNGTSGMPSTQQNIYGKFALPLNGGGAAGANDRLEQLSAFKEQLANQLFAVERLMDAIRGADAPLLVHPNVRAKA